MDPLLPTYGVGDVGNVERLTPTCHSIGPILSNNSNDNQINYNNNKNLLIDIKVWIVSVSQVDLDSVMCAIWFHKTCW